MAKKKGSKASQENRNISAPPPDKGKGLISPYLDWVLLGMSLLLVVSIRVNFLDIPLQRDEGIYSYMGWLQLHGGKPYVDFYEMKPPGLYLTYAFIIALFGYSLEGLHLGFTVLNLISMVLVFLIGRMLLNGRAGVIAALSFGLLSMTPAFHGFSIQGEHMVVTLALTGVFLTLMGLKREALPLQLMGAFAGGLAFIVKQNAVFFLAFSGLMLLLHYGRSSSGGWKLKPMLVKGGLFAGAAMVPALLSLLLLWALGVFDQFVYWVFEYPATYLSAVSLEEGWGYVKYWFLGAMPGYWPFWVLAGLGIAMMWVAKLDGKTKLTLLLFTFFSFLTIVPGLRFYGYYWLMTLPAVGLLMGTFFWGLEKLTGRFTQGKFAAVPGMILLGGLLFWHLQENERYYYKPNFNQIVSRVYSGNGFFEVKVLTDHLKKMLKPEDTLMVFGSETQVYVYTGKKSPSRHIFMSFLSKGTPESKTWAEEARQDVEAAAPDYIFFAMNRYSWNTQDPAFYQWAYSYTQANYVPVGYADVVQPERAKYVWGEDARTYKPSSYNYYVLYKRR